MTIGLALALAGCQVYDGTPEEPPELVDEYGCGYGFYLGSRNQTAALKISYTDFEGAESGEVESGHIGTDPWRGTLQWGTDLFANWCDDVLEPGEPTSDVAESWDVSGTIQFTHMEDGSARAELVGLTATSPEGDEIELGDFEVENEFWGLFAG